MLLDKNIQALQANVRPDGTYTDKSYKVSFGNGLFLLVKPNGRKYWRFKYRFSGKENQLSLGVYPEIGLESAIQQRDEQRFLLKEGISPSLARQLGKKEAALSAITEKMRSRFLYTDTGNLMIKIAHREMILTADETRDLKKFLNNYSAEDE